MSVKVQAALLVLFLLIVATLLFINVTKKPKVELDSPIQTEVLDLGRTIYQANCAQCHGTEGAGYAQAGMQAPALNGSEHSWHHSDEQILGLIRKGGKTMPAVGAQWSDEEVEAVWAYVKQWWSVQQQQAQQGDIGENF